VKTCYRIRGGVEICNSNRRSLTGAVAIVRIYLIQIDISPRVGGPVICGVMAAMWSKL